MDWLTPYSLWKEINEKENTALAILLGSIAIGLAVIIVAVAIITTQRARATLRKA